MSNFRQTMFRSIGTSVLAFSVLMGVPEVWGQGPEPSSGSSRALAIQLLQESHDLSLQLPAYARPAMLRRQVQVVTPLDADLGRQWASELSVLASGEKGIRRSMVQESANEALAGMEPGRALDLLRSMRMGADADDGSVAPPKVVLAARVFQLLVSKEGLRVLPTLEQEAQQMGIEGHYPYSALALAAERAVSQDWASNKAHAVQVIDSEFQLAWQYYRQNPRNYFDDLEFAQMLQIVSGGLPHESLRPALAAFVNNVLATDIARYHFRAELIDTSGNVYKADNAIDAALLYHGAVINRIDPDLARKLESSRPLLNPALDHVRDGEVRSSSIGWGDAQWQPPSQVAEVRADILRMAFAAPEQAILRARQLPKSERAIVELDIARYIAGDSPDQAAALISEAQALQPSADVAMEANLLSAQVALAARGNKDDLCDLLKRAFALTNASVSQEFLAGSVLVPGLAALVQIGIQNEPDLTVQFIHSLAPARLRADALLGAAAALTMPNRLPLRHHLEPTPSSRQQ